MSDAGPTTTTPEDDENFVTPQEQLRKTFNSFGEQIDRVMKRAREADGIERSLMFEMGGTILPLMRDAVGHIGGGLEWHDERIDALEEESAPTVSVLLYEDGDRIEKVLSQHARILEELIPETTDGTEQKEALKILQEETKTLRAWVKDTTLSQDESEEAEEEEGDDDDEEEPEEAAPAPAAPAAEG